MEIKHEHSETKGMFYVEKDEEVLAEMIYRMQGANKMIIDHTEVSSRLEGKGIGKQLVAASVEYARKNNIKILPLCPFAKAIFDRIKEYEDVLFKSM